MINRLLINLIEFCLIFVNIHATWEDWLDKAIFTCFTAEIEFAANSGILDKRSILFRTYHIDVHASVLVFTQGPNPSDLRLESSTRYLLCDWVQIATNFYIQFDIQTIVGRDLNNHIVDSLELILINLHWTKLSVLDPTFSHKYICSIRYSKFNLFTESIVTIVLNLSLWKRHLSHYIDY